MLNYFGANVTAEGTTASIKPGHLFTDVRSWFRNISSAAYFIAAGLLVPNSEILPEKCGDQPDPWRHPPCMQGHRADITLLNGKPQRANLLPGLPDPLLCASRNAIEGAIDLLGSMNFRWSPLWQLLQKEPLLSGIPGASCQRVRPHPGYDGKSSENGRRDRRPSGMIVCWWKSPSWHQDRCLNHGSPCSHVFCSNGTALWEHFPSKNGECVNISYPEFYSDLYSLAE